MLFHSCRHSTSKSSAITLIRLPNGKNQDQGKDGRSRSGSSSYSQHSLERRAGCCSLHCKVKTRRAFDERSVAYTRRFGCIFSDADDADFLETLRKNVILGRAEQQRHHFDTYEYWKMECMRLREERFVLQEQLAASRLDGDPLAFQEVVASFYTGLPGRTSCALNGQEPGQEPRSSQVTCMCSSTLCR
jgi:hypothetical protein